MDYCALGRSVINNEAAAISHLANCLDDHFAKACELILNRSGRVIVSGMGKSGHIARKIASTFSSIGTPAFFMHPGEASHGDLGMLTPDDTLIMISFSGNTPELVSLLAPIKRLQVPIIAMTGHPSSLLASNANIHLHIPIAQEACSLGLAPTTSTTASLVMGDALAIALLQGKGFTTEDFARAHPGGSLGKKLLLRVNELWHTGKNLPIVLDQTPVSDALIEVNEKKLGLTCVVNTNGQLVGVYTDGDIRRTLTLRLDIHNTPIAQVMTKQCKTISPDLLAIDALNLMQTHSITALVGINKNEDPIGVLHLHDLLKAGVV